MSFSKKIRRFCLQNRLFCVLLFTQLAFLLAHFALAMRVQQPIVLAGSELNALSQNAVISGESISMQDKEDYGPFAETPLLDLKKGSYTATVTYESSLEGAKVFQDNDYITMNDQVLEASDGYASFTLWARGNTATSFKFSYNGGTRSIYQFTVTPTHAYARVSSISWLLFFVLADLLLLALRGKLPCICRSSYASRLIWAGLAGLVIFQSLPMFAGFLFSGHDLSFHLSRIEGLASGLAAHEFPVKIYPSLVNGQGYANGVFYGDLLLYIPAVLRLVGFSLQASYQIYVVLINLFTVLAAYWCFGKMAESRTVGLLGAALYSLNLYRLTNLYVRAAVGEYSAMAFLPLILYALWAAFTLPTDASGYKKLWIPGVIGYSGLIVTHILTCGMAAIFTILACLVCIRKVFRKETFAALAKIVIYTTLACLWFLVPFADYMLTDKFRVTAEGFSIWHTIVQSAEPLQVMSFFAKASGAATVLADGIRDDMSFTVGGALLLGSLILPLLCLDPQYVRSSKGRTAAMCLILGWIAMWMATEFFPWYALSEVLPPLGTFYSTMQYGWRFLALTGVFLAAGVSLALLLLKQHNLKIFSITASILCTLMILTSGYFFQDLFQTKDSEFFYEMSDIIATTDHTSYEKQLYQIVMGEYLPIDSHPDKLWLQTNPSYNGDALSVSDYSKIGLTACFSVTNHSDSEQPMTLPFISYNGYRAYSLDGQLAISRAENKQVQISIPAGFSGSVTVRFVEPMYWRVAEAVSLVSVLILTGLGFIPHNRKKKGKSYPIVTEVSAS